MVLYVTTTLLVHVSVWNLIIGGVTMGSKKNLQIISENTDYTIQELNDTVMARILTEKINEINNLNKHIQTLNQRIEKMNQLLKDADDKYEKLYNDMLIANGDKKIKNVVGRKNALTESDMVELCVMRKKGTSIRELARIFKCSPTTVQKCLKQNMKSN